MARLKTYNVNDVEKLIDGAAVVTLTSHGIPSVPRRKLAYDLFFEKFEDDILVDVLLSVIDHYPIYEAQNGKLKCWKAKNHFSLLEYIIISFFTAQIPVKEKSGTKKPKEAEKDNQEMKSTNFFQKLKWSAADIERAIKILIPVKAKSDLWSLVNCVFCLHQTPELLVNMVLKGKTVENASYAALIFVLKNQRFHVLLKNPSILIFAGLMGPLSARMVENFASNRSTEFREECKRLLVVLESCTESRDVWNRVIGEYFSPHGRQRFIKGRNYSQFCNQTISLMKDLRGKYSYENKIDEGYAFVKLKKCAEKFYVSKTWKAEQLHEALYTILHQRPSMRRFVVSLLKNKFDDQESAERWKNADLRFRQRHDVLPFANTKIDFHASNPPYLCIPKEVRSVTFVNNEKKLIQLANKLEIYSYETYPVVGLDAEWSSYLLYSRATILQIAFPDEIFILDLDAFIQTQLACFFKNLFSSDNVIKLGFQFQEDLCHIRRVMPNCESLYNPKNLICIGSLTRMLLTESAKRPDVNVDEFVHPVTSKFSSAVDGSQIKGFPKNSTSAILDGCDKKSDIIEKEELDEKNEVTVEKRLCGLSAYCELLLGYPLDKTEQCSVWDRRPLRDLQIRYASLDAYVMLMMFDKCKDWSSKLGLNVYELCSKQQPVKLQLPLFLF